MGNEDYSNFSKDMQERLEYFEKNIKNKKNQDLPVEEKIELAIKVSKKRKEYQEKYQAKRKEENLKKKLENPDKYVKILNRFRSIPRQYLHSGDKIVSIDQRIELIEKHNGNYERIKEETKKLKKIKKEESKIESIVKDVKLLGQKITFNQAKEIYYKSNKNLKEALMQTIVKYIPEEKKPNKIKKTLSNKRKIDKEKNPSPKQKAKSKFHKCAIAQEDDPMNPYGLQQQVPAKFIKKVDEILKGNILLLKTKS